MDPLSVLASVAQIIALCGTTTTAIVRWSIDVRTADERVRGFQDEIRTLERTYAEVQACLVNPNLKDAADKSCQTADGQRLWTAIRDAADDSLATMRKITEVLDKIQKSSGIVRRPRMQFEESIRKGELGTLRDRLKYFNSNISLSIQMVTCMTQQEQRSLTQTMQRDLDVKFHKLEAMISDVRHRLDRPTADDLRGSTLVVGSVDGSTRGKGNYFDFAKRFVTDASARATERSNLSTISPPIEPTPQFRGGVVGNSPLEKRHTIAMWASDVNVSGGGQPENAMAVQRLQAKAQQNFKLAEAFLKNGPEKAKAGNHESAEKNFRSALAILAKHDFSGRISYHPAEVVLMLAQSCLKQQKYDDCIEMLKRVSDLDENIFPPNCPVEEGVAPAYQADILQSLAACHLLGEVYREIGSYEEAKDHAMKAYDARTDTLGESDPKTIESLELLIQIYRLLGDEETADAFMSFLDVQPSNTSILSAHEEVFSEAATAITVPTVSPPPSEAAAPVIAEPWTNSQPKTNRFKSIFNNRPSISNLHDIKPYTEPLIQPVRRHATEVSGPGLPEPTSPRQMTRIPTRETKDTHRYSTSELAPVRTSSIDVSTSSFKDIVEEVRRLSVSGKTSKAAKIGLERLERYGLNAWPTREPSLRKNIENGKSSARGLAATGKGYAAIHLLCEVPGDHHKDVAVLVKDGADINSGVYQAGFTSGEVFTPILLAISKGNVKCAKVLVEQPNIKLDCKDRSDHTPLLAACRLGYIDVVTAILDKSTSQLPRAYPENWYGNLLTDAARHCELPLVEILLSRNLFDVNKADSWGKTALMYAVIKTDVPASGTDKQIVTRAKMLGWRLEVVKRLLEAGADASLVDGKGNTAARYAQLEGDEELLAVVKGVTRFELAETVPRHAGLAEIGS
jgi:ankyrin repeat protein